MILGIDPIDLRRSGPLGRAFGALAELESLPYGTTEFFEPPARAIVDEAVTAFTRWVYDHSDDEPTFRRGLAYLLTVDDERLLAVTGNYQTYLPPRADVRRRFLRMLWDATFAPPEIYSFFPDDIDLVTDET